MAIVTVTVALGQFGNAIAVHVRDVGEVFRAAGTIVPFRHCEDLAPLGRVVRPKRHLPPLARGAVFLLDAHDSRGHGEQTSVDTSSIAGRRPSVGSQGLAPATVHDADGLLLLAPLARAFLGRVEQAIDLGNPVGLAKRKVAFVQLAGVLARRQESA